MKNNKKIFSVLIVLLPIVIILNIYNSVPSKIIIPQNSEYSLKLNTLCNAPRLQTTAVAGSALYTQTENGIEINTASCGEYTLPVKLFNCLPLKSINVSVTPQKYVIPSGDTVGIKLYTSGILVVNFSQFTDINGKNVSPAKTSGLEKGDRITAVNGNSINTVEELSGYINSENTLLNLTVIRDFSTFNVSVTAAPVSDSTTPKLGMWVRDSTAGIGTLTFYDPATSDFAALGHAICDPDTDSIMKLRKGNLLSCEILSVVKGEHGTPGELVGSFGSNTLGTLKDNNKLGVYGKLTQQNIGSSNPIRVATRFQIKEGAAEIIANVDGKGPKTYSAEITKISKSAKIDNKGLVIKITDKDLIAKTGGIVQGMSGSPIIQNNMLVGAVTHVFVNDPTKGYGIFAEYMLSETMKH